MKKLLEKLNSDDILVILLFIGLPVIFGLGCFILELAKILKGC